jgi:hypothetical protein
LKQSTVLILILCLSVLAGLPLLSEAHAQLGTPVKIGVTTENRQFGWPGGEESFYAQGRYWLFFVNSSSNCEGYTTADCLNYVSSSDSLTWSKATNLNLVAQDPEQDGDYTVLTNSSYVFYSRCNCTGSSTLDDILFGAGQLSKSGTITWQPETRVVQNSTDTENYYGLTMTESSTNQIFIGYTDCASTCSGNPTGSSDVIYSGQRPGGVLVTDSTHIGTAYELGANGAYPAANGEDGGCFELLSPGYIRAVKLDINVYSGVPDGQMEALLYKTASGFTSNCVPSGSPLSTSPQVHVTDNSGGGFGPLNYTWVFPTAIALNASTAYAVSVRILSCTGCSSGNGWYVTEGVTLGGQIGNGYYYSGSAFTAQSPAIFYQINGTSFGSWTGNNQLLCSGTSDGSCPSSGASYVRTVLAPQTVGKVQDVSASGSSGLRGYQYNGGWTAQGSISNPTGYNPSCSGFMNIYDALPVWGDLTAVFWPPTSDASTCFNLNTGGSWQTSLTFFQFAPCKSGILFSCFSVTYDQNTGNYFMFDYFQSSSNITIYAGTNPTTWKPSQTVSTASANGSDYLRSMQQTVTFNSTSYTVPAWFTTGTSSPYGLYYEVLPETIPIPPAQGNSPPPPGGNQPVPVFQTTHVLILGFNLTLPIQLASRTTILIVGVVALAVLSSSLLYDLASDKKRKTRRVSLV